MYKKSCFPIINRYDYIENVKRYKPDWIINCAAYTNVDKAEVQQELAFNINSLAPKYFSEAIKDYGGNLLHVSTDYVFSGTKKTPYLTSDEKSPINKYGYTKAKGEDFILENSSSP